MKWVLHQGFANGELHAWMKKCHSNQHCNTFAQGSSLEGQVSWTTSNPWTRNLASWELQLEAISLKKCFPSCKPYQMLPQLRAGLHHGPWSGTMGDGLFPWSDSMVQLPWSNFFFKYQFTKPLGPLLGVNRMWTKRNHHAPKNECAGFFTICPKSTFEKVKVWPFYLSSMVFIFFLSPKKLHRKIYHNIISLPRTIALFSTWAPILLFPLQNPLDHVSAWCRP